MLEKKRPEKIRPTIELEKVITEILVANGRAIEPFVKVFNYSDENVTRSSLGSLIGVFEIAENSEDSAYIINFLASVAKKEYFSNPRRGSIESFEAALHKINLALAELVKHGNIAWLGKLHGALGVLEKNNLHFSVTGKAEILLLRGDNFSEISSGLASEESNIHPIKTFVEVSSGRLMAQDKIILTSPELFDILPMEDLEKNAVRMDTERFAQFLRTALINELDMGGSLVVDIKEGLPLPLPHKESKKAVETTANVFSGQAFVPRPTTEQAAGQPTEHASNNAEEEYTDSKTGHIYVQGDTPRHTQGYPFLERTKLSLQDSSHALGSFFISQGKLLRKGKKQSLLFLYALSRQSVVVTRKTTRFLRKQLRNGIVASASKIATLRLPKKSQATAENTRPDNLLQTAHIPTPLSQPSSAKKIESTLPAPAVTEALVHNASARIAADEDEVIPPFMRDKLAAFYQKNSVPPPITHISVVAPAPQTFRKKRVTASFAALQKTFHAGWLILRALWEKGMRTTRDLFNHSFRSFKKLGTRYEKRTLMLWLLAAAVLVTSLLLARYISTKNSPTPIAETPQAPSETSVFPLEDEKNAHALANAPITIATVPDSVIASVVLSDEIYLITSAYILSTDDEKQYPLPPGKGAIKFASPMDDLRLIFVYTDTNALFSWSPISHTFTENTLALPADARVEDIGTYLTYLYVLDETTDQIYRFPRAEGGFGTGSPWLKDTLAIEDSAKMAIHETIFLAQNRTTVSAVFRGRFVKNLESPNTPLSVTSLFTNPDLANIYALDADNKRILVWNQDGALIAQYFSETLADAQTITVNEKTSEALVTTAHSLLSFKLNLEQ
ncbi:MAG: hypothetical protein WAV46_02690 [Candidatus Moraniibacteriota bacterium]